jgi:hypothetical protein
VFGSDDGDGAGPAPHHLLHIIGSHLWKYKIENVKLKIGPWPPFLILHFRFSILFSRVSS